MTDLTPDFNICLKAKGAELVVKKEYDIKAINSFLKEAYVINEGITNLIRELRDIRPAYLSAAQPSRRRQVESNDRPRLLSDKERDAFDAQSKQVLRELNRAITSLKQAEDVGNQAAESAALSKRAGGGMIGRWVAGGGVTSKSPEEEREEAARNTKIEVRKNIIMFLQEKLGRAGSIQSQMMDVRLNREVEKSKSILAKSPISGGVPRAWNEESGLAPPSATSAKRSSAEMDSSQDLTQEQLQMFAEENHELLKHYEDQLDQVRTVEQSILEISELQSILHGNLVQQNEKIDQLVQDSYLTTENLGKGNKELKRASERRSTAQAIFYGTVAFCSFLVVWDLIF